MPKFQRIRDRFWKMKRAFRMAAIPFGENEILKQSVQAQVCEEYPSLHALSHCTGEEGFSGSGRTDIVNLICPYQASI
jgi:hypothetical protein